MLLQHRQLRAEGIVLLQLRNLFIQLAARSVIQIAAKWHAYEHLRHGSMYIGFSAEFQ